MAENSWLKSRFGDLSKLLGRAKRNTGPISSTPFAIPHDNDRKTPSAPPLPENSPVRGEMGLPSKRFSVSEPNITTVGDSLIPRVSRYRRNAQVGIEMNAGSQGDSEASSSDRNTPSVEEGVPQGPILGPRDNINGNNDHVSRENACSRDTQTVEAPIKEEVIVQDTPYVFDVPKKDTNVAHSRPLSGAGGGGGVPTTK